MSEFLEDAYTAGFVHGATMHIEETASGVDPITGEIIYSYEVGAVVNAKTVDKIGSNGEAQRQYMFGVAAGQMCRPLLNPDSSVPLPPGIAARRTLFDGQK